MRVFLSWSGIRSRMVADALATIIPDIVQDVDPFFSRHITAGARWSEDLATELEATDVGILCLTRENLQEPWIMFEAGALSKKLRHSLVCPYLLDVDPSALKPPLSQFQAVRADPDGTLHVLMSINKTLATPLDPVRLERCFRRCWDELKGALAAIPPSELPEPQPSEKDLLQQLISMVRGLQSAAPQPSAEQRPAILQLEFEDGPVTGRHVINALHEAFIAARVLYCRIVGAVGGTAITAVDKDGKTIATAMFGTNLSPGTTVIYRPREATFTGVMANFKLHYVPPEQEGTLVPGK